MTVLILTGTVPYAHDILKKAVIPYKGKFWEPLDLYIGEGGGYPMYIGEGGTLLGRNREPSRSTLC